MTATTSTHPMTAPWPAAAVAPTVTLGRSVLVELRKTLDTRAGLWLLGLALAGGVVAAVGWVLLSGEATAVPWTAPLIVVASPMGVLLPVVAILTFTQEWSQRTALTTFTAEPRRGRVLAAKLLAVALITLAGLLASIVFTVVVALVVGARANGTIVWGTSAAPILTELITLAISVAVAAGLGMLLMNSPTAIVANFLIPTVTATLSLLPGVWGTIGTWISGVTWAQLPGPMTAIEVGQAATAFALWALLPLALGWWRTLRTEVK